MSDAGPHRTDTEAALHWVASLHNDLQANGYYPALRDARQDAAVLRHVLARVAAYRGVLRDIADNEFALPSDACEMAREVLDEPAP